MGYIYFHTSHHLHNFNHGGEAKATPRKEEHSKCSRCCSIDKWGYGISCSEQEGDRFGRSSSPSCFGLDGYPMLGPCLDPGVARPHGDRKAFPGGDGSCLSCTSLFVFLACTRMHLACCCLMSDVIAVITNHTPHPTPFWPNCLDHLMLCSNLPNQHSGSTIPMVGSPHRVV